MKHNDDDTHNDRNKDLRQQVCCIENTKILAIILAIRQHLRLECQITGKKDAKTNADKDCRDETNV